MLITWPRWQRQRSGQQLTLEKNVAEILRDM